MNNFLFLRPLYIYLFIPFFILFVIWATKLIRKNRWQKICSENLLPFVVASKKTNFFLSFLTLPLGISLLIIGMSGPSFKETEIPVLKEPTGIVILLDLSNAMNADDVKPTRLQRAIYKIHDLLETFKEKQLALIVFSEKAFVVTPLTEDRANIEAQLGALSTSIMPSQGHNVELAIKKASDLLSQSNMLNGTILLMTGELSQKELDKAASAIKETKHKLSVFGVGHDEKTPIPKDGGGFVKDKNGILVMAEFSQKNLRKLAAFGNGIYTKLTQDQSDIKLLKRNLAPSNVSMENQSQGKFLKEPQDQGYLFVLLAIPLISLIFRRGFLVCLLLIPHFGEASNAKKAEEHFFNEEYNEAKKLFDDNDWKACSHYKLKEYKEAADIFSQTKTAEGFYNYGTSKAKLLEFDEALKAYEETLKLDPEHEDAKFNKQLIEEHLKQQQNSQSQEDDQESDSNNSTDSSDGCEDQKKDNHHSKDKDEKNQDQKEDFSESENDLKDKENENVSDKRNEPQSDKEKDMQDNEDENEVEPKKEEKENEQERQQQIDNRWLKRIKDDPGELLRRKFLQQYKNKS